MFTSRDDLYPFDNEDVKELIDMGYIKDMVIEALGVCGGDKERAANYLLNAGGSSNVEDAIYELVDWFWKVMRNLNHLII